MKYEIRKTVLKYISDMEFWQRDAEKLRGYFGNLYEEENLFHNHQDNILLFIECHLFSTRW